MGLARYIILCLLGIGCINDVKDHTLRPANIPGDSFWAGGQDHGNWFHIKSINNHRNIARIAIYSDQTGNLITDKAFMIVCNAGKSTFIHDLKKQIDSFDGKNIYLIKSDSVHCWLQPVN